MIRLCQKISSETITIPPLLIPQLTIALVPRRPNSRWADVPFNPPDSIFGLLEAFHKDPSPNKINLGIGAYRTDSSQPYVLPSVRKAEEKLRKKNLNKEYSFIAGSTEFCQLSFDFALGEDNVISKEGLNATVQTISGTGALSLMALFLKRFYPGEKTIYLPKHTWNNHITVFSFFNLPLDYYRYYDEPARKLDYQGLIEDLSNIPDASMVLFHPCAHNPTGMDPDQDQWVALSRLAKEKDLFVLFDMAYQGFATGDADVDAFAVRQFASEGVPFALSQSWSKNMGLYGERTGALTILGDSKDDVRRILSQLKGKIRAIYSNPPIHGARIVTEILTDPELKQQWLGEMKGMIDRMISVRKVLRESLLKYGSVHDWGHIVKQKGMFCFTGMDAKQVERMTREFKIYMGKDGRISIAGVTTKNVDYIARAMHEVTK
ncbi:unnamed protein product [Phaedon cochleariae]|uniref:Aspartate aminotransferase, mitochondrial n=1 Tax=Phaedon cochleariae TaxID=80249 RepID=A0A9P0GM13_PHACE|nr:unnamed protein product [Phaedon cochleariae]